MDYMVKKYQQKFRKMKHHMDRWEELHSLLLSQFRNASSIIQRLQLIQDLKKYGSLKSVDGIGDAVFSKQMDSLQSIFLSINKTMEEFHGVVILLERIARDGRQLVKGGSSVQPKIGQLKQQIGIKPSLADCLEWLVELYHMHQSEYLLKSSVVSALPTITLEPSGTTSASCTTTTINTKEHQLQDQLFKITLPPFGALDPLFVIPLPPLHVRVH